MIIKEIRDEDFTSYKEPAMVIGFPSCNFKCCKEGGFPVEVCQNCDLMDAPAFNISEVAIMQRYNSNPITSAIVCGGMEPMDSWVDLKTLIATARCYTFDDIVIYTGYEQSEIQDKIEWLSMWPNIVVKMGRYKHNGTKKYDDVLGVTLASSNQYAIRIS